MNFNEYEKEELLTALYNYTCTLNYEQQSMEHKKTIGTLITKLENE